MAIILGHEGVFVLGDWESWKDFNQEITQLDLCFTELSVDLGASQNSLWDIPCCACMGFTLYSFYYVEVYSFYSCFLEIFYHKWMLNFVKGFLCIY